MKRRMWLMVALLMLLPMALMMTACAKRGVTTETQVDQAALDAERARQDELARQRALEEERLQQEKLLSQQAQDAERTRFMNENIYFEFDKYRLLPEAQEILRNKADWMKANPDVTAIIEGHTDERGTTEYNLALGERRAESAKSFLVDLGISASRLTTISYGEERPIDPRSNEEAWAKNRRAQFVIE